jgi:hypothetical protein
MRRQRFAFLLLLLLASAWVDDAWLTAATGSGEESPAAQDNEYLQPSSDASQLSARAFQLPTFRGAFLLVAETGGTREFQRSVQSAAALAPPLLYVLMSMQC